MAAHVCASLSQSPARWGDGALLVMCREIKYRVNSADKRDCDTSLSSVLALEFHTTAGTSSLSVLAHEFRCKSQLFVLLVLQHALSKAGTSLLSVLAMEFHIRHTTAGTSLLPVLALKFHTTAGTSLLSVLAVEFRCKPQLCVFLSP